MSGICGVVGGQLAGESQQYLGAMLRGLHLSDVGRQNMAMAIAGAAGFGALSFAGRIASIAQISVHGCPVLLVLYGNLINTGTHGWDDTSDADVTAGVLHLYLKEGLAFLQQLRGEFVLALWDGRKETCYLATDRFRVHSLVYHCEGEYLVFASRLQGILAAPFPWQRTIRNDAIVDVVASSVIPTPKTIFREVEKLPPGQVLSWHDGKAKLMPYWEIDFRHSDDGAESELACKLKAHFADAISVRATREPHPHRVGTFLSGGVDSSTVTGVLKQELNGAVKSFSVGFAEQEFNEISYARIVARAFGIEHHEYFVTARDVYDAIPLVLKSFDEPFANASAIPTYFCAMLAKAHGVDTLYAGDGGDELFAGNERYAVQRLFDYYYKIPRWLREAVVQRLVFTAAGIVPWRPVVSAKKYIQRASIPYPQRLSSYGFFHSMPLAELLTDDVLAEVGCDYDPDAPMHRYYFAAPASSDLDRQLYIDLKLAICDNDVLKVTRMTEAAGTEVRFPFLDHALAEFAATIPAQVKMRGRRVRSFFKAAYADLLPQEVRTKTKHGFGVPIPVWLRTDANLREMMHDLLLSPRSIQRGYFRKTAVEEIVVRHAADTTSFYGTIIWNLMILELWQRTYAETVPFAGPCVNPGSLERDCG